MVAVGTGVRWRGVDDHTKRETERELWGESTPTTTNGDHQALKQRAHTRACARERETRRYNDSSEGGNNKGRREKESSRGEEH